MGEKPSEIALFVCDWSVNPIKVSDEALSSFSADIRLVKVKCTGRIDPVFYIDSFLKGMDGVLVVGCKRGDCHFIEGNLQAEYKIKMVGKLLGLAGFEPGRLSAEWMSALDEAKFEESLNEFVDRIRAMGDSPLSTEQPDPLLNERMLAARATVEGFRDRALASKELEVTEKGNVYGEIVPQSKFDEIQEDALRAEFFRNWIYLLLKKSSSSIGELSSRTGLRRAQVLRHIVAMRQRNLVSLDHLDGITPYYGAMEAL
ncbi:hydrogenase iron-sulfur subunit [Candidatus Bathyarchaeota archaeon]|nr:hydrogenase iron-sulfur subunit [Candidatus Bathyarchaeota archaeon]